MLNFRTIAYMLTYFWREALNSKVFFKGDEGEVYFEPLRLDLWQWMCRDYITMILGPKDSNYISSTFTNLAA